MSGKMLCRQGPWAAIRRVVLVLAMLLTPFARVPRSVAQQPLSGTTKYTKDTTKGDTKWTEDERPAPMPEPTLEPRPAPIALPPIGAQQSPSSGNEAAARSPRPASSSLGALGPSSGSVSAPLVTREEALSMLQNQVQQRVLTSPDQEAALQFPSEALVTTDIWLLACALDFDPALIFEYVHNHIDYVPTFGSANGATGTLLAGRGNDFDQTSLFIALMRASGYTANYMRGIVGYSMSRLANWMGVAEDQVPQVVTNGGMIGVVDPPGDRMRLFRYWATVENDPQTYWFDPAMKEYEEVAGTVDLQTVMGYDRAAFLARATAGATVTSDAVRNLNESNVRADLVTYSMNLVNYLRQNMPEATMDDVLGGRRIVPVELTEYPTELPFALSVQDTAPREEMPDASRHTLCIRYEGIDHTFATSEISGRRITLTHLGENRDQATLVLDNDIIARGNTVEHRKYYTCTVEVDHPYPAENGTYADQSYAFQVLGGTFYVLAHDFGDVSPGLLASRRDFLALNRMLGLQDLELYWGESLWMIGLGWQHQVRLLMGILDRLGRTTTPMHHMVGLVGPIVTYGMDIGLFAYSCNAAQAGVDTRAVSRAIRVIYSGLESAVLEQVQDASRPGVSATRVLQLNNALGRRTFLAHAGNWATIRPQLVNYYWWRLDALTDEVNGGARLVLPEDAQTPLEDWVGLGYISYVPGREDASVGLIIGGGYASTGSGGGQVATFSTLDAEMCLEALEYWTGVPSDQNPAISTPHGGDPINMATGACVYANTDLTVGAVEPFALRLERSYNSRTHYYEQVLGRGWRHSYEMAVQERSKGDLALGMGQPAEAAGMVAAAYVVVDLLPGDADVVEWVSSVVAGKWAADQVLHNSVTVQMGSQVLEFTRLPDGSYSSPPGMTLRLTQQAGGYRLDSTYGTHYEFDSTGKVVRWQDANANALTFAYDGGGLLHNVSNGLGITLTFTYSGSQLSEVTDMAGRSVSYGYTDGNLTAYRAATGGIWRYEYDDENRLTAIYSPASPVTATITNAYDDLDRVEAQMDALGNVSTYSFSRFRNEEERPDGSRVVHYFNSRGDYVAREDAAGQRVEMEYDGLHRLRALTDRLGGTTAFGFDPLSGALGEHTDALSQSTTFTYTLRAEGAAAAAYDLTRVTYPDSTHRDLTHDPLGNLLSYSDRLGKVWRYTNNDRGQPLTVTGPGRGVITYTYGLDGLLASHTDSDVGLTGFGYDAFKRLAVITRTDGSTMRFTLDPVNRGVSLTNELDQVSFFGFDANNNLTRLTDPLGQSTNLAYDGLDRLIGVTDALGKSTARGYDALGQLSFETDANGLTTTYGYNVQGWVDSVTDAAGGMWRIERNNESVWTAISSPLGFTITQAVDALGRTTAISDALGSPRHFTYATSGRLSTATDRMGRTAALTYDAEGRLRDASWPLIGTAQYARDDEGHVTQVLDLLGKAWSWTYSPMGRIASQSDPLGSGITYGYDGRGRLTAVGYPTGGAAAFTYDATGQLTQSVFPGGPTRDFAYDDAGRLVDASSQSGQVFSVTLGYDARGDVTRMQQGAAVLAASYDDGRRLHTLTYPALAGAGSSTVVTYTYDERNQVTRVEDSRSQAWVSFSYDADGRLTSMSRSNGVSTTLELDAVGHVTRIQEGSAGASPLVDLAYTLNAEGEPLQASGWQPLDAAPSGGSLALTYDDAARISTPGYAYDALGRETAAPGVTFSYDGDSRLTRVVSSDATVDLSYDAFGYLTARSEAGGVPVTTTYVHNYAVARAPVVAEVREEASMAAGELAKLTAAVAQARLYVYTPDGSLLYSLDAASGQVRFYHFDRLDSTLFLSDGSGGVTDAYAYNAYGNLLRHAGSSDQPFAFIGRQGVRWEPVGGLYQMGARYYSPAAARFLTRDPEGPDLTIPQSLNPYQYAYQNPLRYTDPLGGQSSAPVLTSVGAPSNESVGKGVSGPLWGDVQPWGIGPAPLDAGTSGSWTVDWEDLLKHPEWVSLPKMEAETGFASTYHPPPQTDWVTTAAQPNAPGDLPTMSPEAAEQMQFNQGIRRDLLAAGVPYNVACEIATFPNLKDWLPPWGFKYMSMKEIQQWANKTQHVDETLSLAGFCAIATAAYGTPLDPHVVALRAFRDRYLLTTAPGRAFVRLYYALSPPVARAIARQPVLRALARAALAPVVYTVVYPLHALAALLLLVAAAILARRLLRRRPA